MLLFCVLFVGVIARADCRSFFAFVDPRPTWVEPVLLGEGRYSKTWLRQSHQNFFSDKEFGPGSQAEDDVAAFAGHVWMLRLGPPTGFRVPPWVSPRVAARRSPSLVMPGYRIPYYPGRTVLDLVMDETVPHHVREDVRRAYLSAFAKYKAIIESQLGPCRSYDWTFASQLPWMSFALPPAALDLTVNVSGPVEMTIKPDNVIVDPWSLELTIIDPY